MIVIDAKNVGLKRIIVLGGCNPRVDVSGLVTGGGDFALFVQVFQGRQAPARIMGYSLSVFVRHLGGVRPAL